METLLNNLQERLEDARDEAIYSQTKDFHIRLEIPEIKAIISLLKGGWVSVKERLPERGETIFFATEYGYVTQGFLAYDIDGVWVESFTTTEYANVTHWMPLPPNPTE